MIDDYINKLSNSNNNIGGGNVDNSCLLLYYSENRRKFQAICLDFEKQKGFFREEKGVDRLWKCPVRSVEKRRKIVSDGRRRP